MKLFYTTPDNATGNYPYILVPFHKVKLLRKFKWKQAIVDSGVFALFAQGHKDYPASFFSRYTRKAWGLTQIYGDKISFVIPDYPDDYRNNPIPHNVKKTLRNIRKYSEVKDINWIYPIQCDYMNLQSLHDSCHEVMKFDPEKLAIGTVCKTNNIEYIEKSCIMVRRHFYTQNIHAFGVTLSALPRVLPHIDSWDSMAWTFPRGQGHSCKTMDERRQYFKTYLEKIETQLRNFNSQERLEVKL